jgi:hypothetical protein
LHKPGNSPPLGWTSGRDGFRSFSTPLFDAAILGTFVADEIEAGDNDDLSPTSSTTRIPGSGATLSKVIAASRESLPLAIPRRTPTGWYLVRCRCAHG